MSYFRPLPLLGNPHVQTILGNLLPGSWRPLRVNQRAVTLPDGDRIVLHETPAPNSIRDDDSQAPIAVLVHGLGGCHRSAYMVRMTHRLGALGWRVVRLDLRGAGAGAGLARRLYTAGCSDDLRAVVAHLATAWPNAPIVVLGFSLGGNIVLKLAGELGGDPPPALRGVAVFAPPIDLMRCSELIARLPFYDRFFVRHLTRQVAENSVFFPDAPRVMFPRRLTLRQFDDLYTAPRWGYADAADYYTHASSAPRIHDIRVRTFILTARDDPFIAVAPFDALPALASVDLHISPKGGHLGFLGADGAGGIRWAETQLVSWLTKQIQLVDSGAVS